MSERHKLLAELFDQLVALPPDARDAALRECDADMRERLERLLVADTNDADPVAHAVVAGADALVRPTASGARLGAWRVLREVGVGGMGSVLLAERADGQFDQQVAIKLIRGFPTEEGKRRLRQERQILAQLDHPNIARLLDGGESDDGQPFVVMEYVDGLPLLAHVAARAPELASRLDLFDRIAAAVQHAHERLVIHRDLKPGNVLVRNDGQPKLLDFGVAKLVDLSAHSDPRQTSTRVWTPGYASPEQQSGALVTTATDVYGLAVLLREMLTGEREPGVSAPMPDGFQPLPLNAELRGILAKASAAEPAQRYPTVEAFRADLQRWRDGRPVHAAPDTRAYRMRKFLVRHRVGAALTAVALAIAIGFVWRLALERSRAVAAEQRATVALKSAEREGANARAALAFLSDAIGAARPENALSTQVSVRDLLDHARDELDKRAQADPQLRQPIQRMLGHLYASLGESKAAAELFAAGLKDVTPRQKSEAIAFADDLDGYSDVLATLERGKESLAIARQSAELRSRHAPRDAIQRLKMHNQLAVALDSAGDHKNAEAQWTRALAEVKDVPAAPVRDVLETYKAFGHHLFLYADYARGLKVADEGLAFADRHSLPANSPLRADLLFAKAQSSYALNDPAAETMIRQAIAMQERSVGPGGAQMAELYSLLGVSLQGKERFKEALEAHEHSSQLSQAAAGTRPLDRALTLSNIGYLYRDYGDYAKAVELAGEAVSVLAASDIEADHIERRRIEKYYAFNLAFAGRGAEARARLLALRERSRKLDGEDSFEYAELTWRLMQVAERMGDLRNGVPLLEETRMRVGKLLPKGHFVFGQLFRSSAAFARMHGDLAAAESDLQQSLKLLHGLYGAMATAELADVRAARDDKVGARKLLDQALPVLRETVLAQQVDRARAEDLERQL
ncbi:serine/threonine protein kinase [Lysobacter fragariae]